MLFSNMLLWMTDGGGGLRVTLDDYRRPEPNRDVAVTFEGVRSFRFCEWNCSLQPEESDLSAGAICLGDDGVWASAAPGVWWVAEDEVGTLYVDADAFTSERTAE